MILKNFAKFCYYAQKEASQIDRLKNYFKVGLLFVPLNMYERTFYSICST